MPRKHVCIDCGQEITDTNGKWAAHLAKHGRVVSHPHASALRGVTDEDDPEDTQ